MLLLVSLLLLSRPLGLEGRSATAILSNLGTRFEPANPIELLDQFSTPYLSGCSIACMNNEGCRTFDYDSACKQCRLFEGEVSTGTVVPSPSMTSKVGHFVLVPEYYTSYNQTSDQCQWSRYLIVDTGTNLCRCPRHTYWNGSMCLNQVYEGSSCAFNASCRTDLYLNCDTTAHVCTATGYSTARGSHSHSTTQATTEKVTSVPIVGSTDRSSMATSPKVMTSPKTTAGMVTVTRPIVASTFRTTGMVTTPFFITYNATYPAPVNSSNAASGQYGVNLLVNGDSETGPCAVNTTFVSPTQWSLIGTIMQSFYNNSAYSGPTPVSPGPSNRGSCYFYGGTDGSSTMSQSIDLNPYIGAINAGNVSFNISGWLGGYQAQDDYGRVSVNFLNQFYQPIGNQTTIGPVLAADRANTTSLLPRQTGGPVPTGSRYVTILVAMVRSGGADNDGAADNIALALSHV